MRYAQSLDYNISMCDFLLRTVGWVDSVGEFDEDESDQQEAVDFLHDLRNRYRGELEDLNNGTHWVQTGATQ